MPATPNAVLIATDGHTVPIALPDDPDQRYIVMKAAICCHTLEAVDLTDNWAMWLDETGGMLGQPRRPLSPAATLVANRYGVTGGIRGPVVITGTSELGTVPLTTEGVAAVKAVVTELLDVRRVTPS